MIQYTKMEDIHVNSTDSNQNFVNQALKSYKKCSLIYTKHRTTKKEKELHECNGEKIKSRQKF